MFLDDIISRDDCRSMVQGILIAVAIVLAVMVIVVLAYTQRDNKVATLVENLRQDLEKQSQDAPPSPRPKPREARDIVLRVEVDSGVRACRPGNEGNTLGEGAPGKGAPGKEAPNAEEPALEAITPVLLVHQEPNFADVPKSLPTDPNTYGAEDLARLGVQNTQIRSVKVPAGVRVRMLYQDNMGSREVVYTGPAEASAIPPGYVGAFIVEALATPVTIMTRQQKAYVGCFRDNDVDRGLPEALGPVDSAMECIAKGSKKGLKYVGVQNYGRDCFGGNELVGVRSHGRVSDGHCRLRCSKSANASGMTEDPECGKDGNVSAVYRTADVSAEDVDSILNALPIPNSEGGVSIVDVLEGPAAHPEAALPPSIPRAPAPTGAVPPPESSRERPMPPPPPAPEAPLPAPPLAPRPPPPVEIPPPPPPPPVEILPPPPPPVQILPPPPPPPVEILPPPPPPVQILPPPPPPPVERSPPPPPPVERSPPPPPPPVQIPPPPVQILPPPPPPPVERSPPPPPPPPVPAPAPVDCEVSWGEFGPCDADGNQVRKATVTRQPMHQGKACPAVLEETRKCASPGSDEADYAKQTVLGCYKDAYPRVFKTHLGIVKTGQQPLESCRARAKARGYKYFGIGNLGWCYGDNDLEKVTRLGRVSKEREPFDCNYRCTADFGRNARTYPSPMCARGRNVVVYQTDA
jgi:hypothetical protein